MLGPGPVLNGPCMSIAYTCTSCRTNNPLACKILSYNVDDTLSRQKPRIRTLLAASYKECALFSPPLGSGCWKARSPQGVPPSPRTLHCTTSAMGTSLLVFSGGTTGTTPTDDQNVYCLETGVVAYIPL